jgi:hypothetical protein
MNLSEFASDLINSWSVFQYMLSVSPISQFDHRKLVCVNNRKYDKCKKKAVTVTRNEMVSIFSSSLIPCSLQYILSHPRIKGGMLSFFRLLISLTCSLI